MKLREIANQPDLLKIVNQFLTQHNGSINYTPRDSYHRQITEKWLDDGGVRFTASVLTLSYDASDNGKFSLPFTPIDLTELKLREYHLTTWDGIPDSVTVLDLISGTFPDPADLQLNLDRLHMQYCTFSGSIVPLFDGHIRNAVLAFDANDRNITITKYDVDPLHVNVYDGAAEEHNYYFEDLFEFQQWMIDNNLEEYV